MRLPSDYIVFDLETTGLSPAYSEIIEIGAVKIIDGKIEDIFQTYVKNTSPIPEKITALTGITENDTKNAPKISRKRSNCFLMVCFSFIGKMRRRVRSRRC